MCLKCIVLVTIFQNPPRTPSAP